jgi:copper chaperone CopZ
MRTYLRLILFSIFFSNSLCAQFVKAELQAAGLTCSMCSKAVDKQLRTLDFVDSVGIDLSHATFVLYFKKNKPVDLYLVRKKVEDAGFSVAMLKATYVGDHIKLENGFFTEGNRTYQVIVNAPSEMNGEVILKVVDKGFVSDKEFKKLGRQIKGDMNEKLLHVMILQK